MIAPKMIAKITEHTPPYNSFKNILLNRLIFMGAVMVFGVGIMVSNSHAFDSRTKFKVRYERIAGDIVGITMPDWKNTGNNVQYTLNKGFSQFIVAPSNVPVEKARQMHIFTIMDVKDDVTPLSYFDYLMTKEINACGEQNATAQVWQKTNKYLLALMICGENNNGKSDTRLMNVYRVDTKIISIVHRWIGRKYNPNLSQKDIKASNQKMPISNKDVTWFQSGGAGLQYCVNVSKNKACKPLKESYDKAVKQRQNMMRFVLTPKD